MRAWLLAYRSVWKELSCNTMNISVGDKQHTPACIYRHSYEGSSSSAPIEARMDSTQQTAVRNGVINE